MSLNGTVAKIRFAHPVASREGLICSRSSPLRLHRAPTLLARADE
jgi:hypothetical protein